MPVLKNPTPRRGWRSGGVGFGRGKKASLRPLETAGAVHGYETSPERAGKRVRGPVTAGAMLTQVS
jgi:hypothetical protein